MPLNRSSNLIVWVEMKILWVGVPSHRIKASFKQVSKCFAWVVVTSRRVQNVEPIQLRDLLGLCFCEGFDHLTSSVLDRIQEMSIPKIVVKSEKCKNLSKNG